jgi:hypothetical protein
MTEATVLLGTLKDTENSKNTLLCNHMLLITKKYIFEKKQKQITFKSLQRKVYDTMKIEDEIAKKNNRMEKFLKKWEKCPTALETLLFLTPWPIFVHTSSPSFSPSLFLFLIQKITCIRENILKLPVPLNCPGIVGSL